MSNIIEKYYQGINQQLRAEVNFINSIFHHQGVKGEGNETLIRDLIAKFIPKKYGVSTGIIIDREGRQSKQCDIIIYDAFLYPSLLSLTTAKLFPIDIVYASIEVKTTLDSNSYKEALSNIRSVKDLDIIKDKFGTPAYENGKLVIIEHETRHPLGFVFAYSSEAQMFETFKSWFTPVNKFDTQKFPVLVGCLDQGIVLYQEIYPHGDLEPEGRLIPLLGITEKDETGPIKSPEPLDEYSYEGTVYPVKKFQGDYYVIDQGRTLLHFILGLNEMLSQKKINPEVSIANKYTTMGNVGFHIKC